MKAMILAAGRGERMRPLTDTTPKPSLAVGGKALIVWHLERLARAGFREIVINHAWLGSLVEATVGADAPKSLGITYSPEGEAADSALETAGGIAQALPLITTRDEPFLVINGDIWCDFDVGRAATIALQMRATNALAHLVMVPNPPQHAAGDFALAGARIYDDRQPCLTFSGIGVYRPALFDGVVRGAKAKLAPLLRAAMRTGRVSGEWHGGEWQDIGTPERLAALDARLRATQDATQHATPRATPHNTMLP